MATDGKDSARAAGQPDARGANSANGKDAGHPGGAQRASGAGRRPPVGGARTVLGTVDGSGELAWRAGADVFELDGAPVRLARVRALDAQGLVRWRFLEQRDWMRRLPPGPCDAAFERAIERLEEGLTPAERLDAQIRRHVRKDDSYLHGRIVEEPAGDSADDDPSPDPGGDSDGDGRDAQVAVAAASAGAPAATATDGRGTKPTASGRAAKARGRGKREKQDKPAKPPKPAAPRWPKRAAKRKVRDREA